MKRLPLPCGCQLCEYHDDQEKERKASAQPAASVEPVIDFLVRLKRWRDNKWSDDGDRPSSPPAVLLGIESVIQALSTRGGAE